MTSNKKIQHLKQYKNKIVFKKALKSVKSISYLIVD